MRKTQPWPRATSLEGDHGEHEICAFSLKAVNHMAAVSPYFMWYNFGRVHQTLRLTPAMEAGVSDRVWSVEEIVGLIG